MLASQSGGLEVFSPLILFQLQKVSSRWQEIPSVAYRVFLPGPETSVLDDRCSDSRMMLRACGWWAGRECGGPWQLLAGQQEETAQSQLMPSWVF